MFSRCSTKTKSWTTWSRGTSRRLAISTASLPYLPCSTIFCRCSTTNNKEQYSLQWTNSMIIALIYYPCCEQHWPPGQPTFQHDVARSKIEIAFFSRSIQTINQTSCCSIDSHWLHGCNDDTENQESNHSIVFLLFNKWSADNESPFVIFPTSYIADADKTKAKSTNLFFNMPKHGLRVRFDMEENNDRSNKGINIRFCYLDSISIIRENPWKIRSRMRMYFNE